MMDSICKEQTEPPIMQDLRAAVKATNEIVKENSQALFFIEQGKTFSLSVDGGFSCLYRACTNGTAGDFMLMGKPRYFATENGLNKAIAAHF
jgi:hypothetical protein